ncbi:radical SAM protein [Clostridioides difficile]|nr:radical SAM protein [Clostridioides difficile]EGT3851088.1 radical SAM protein [Clostridioides difficile]EGT4004751.1 radical SAM protein [Clostridioides difficile]EKG0756271.1 radical SAM protein [Clostridioides difficile]EKG0783981.1 radical SAM protein [Clostridioides difficile]
MNLEYHNKVIRYKKNTCYIYDKVSKKHMFISKEVFNYLKKAEEYDLNISKFIDGFEDTDDKEYMKLVISNLKKIGFIKNYEYERRFINTENNNFESIYIMVTDKCNLNCRHCTTNCSPDGENILSTQNIKDIIYNISLLNPKNIIFTGGEPLIRKDIEEIVDFAKQNIKDSSFSLSTNSTLISNENVSMIKRLFDHVDISIDGVDELSCSKIRGKGVFGKVLNSIKLLQENGLHKISLSMVFSSSNEHLRDDFIELNKSLKTIPIERAFIPEGRGYDNILDFEYENIHIPKSIPSIYNIENKYEKLSRNISSCSCNAFKNNLFIDSNGDVYPCPSLIKSNYKITNLAYKKYTKQQIIDMIRMRSIDFSESLEYRDSKCEKCDLNIFCWDCPANFERAKEYGEIDNWCNLMKKNLDNIVWR